MPFVKKFVDLGLHGGLTKIFYRTPLYEAQKYNFRYSEAVLARPKDFHESKEVIDKMHALNIHPGAYEWRNTTSYGGAVFSAIHNVDIIRSRKDPNYCHEKFHAVVEPYPTWETTLTKTAISFFLMSYGLPIPYIGTIGVSTDFSKVICYLGINAFRNIVSDLGAKHGREFIEWLKHLEHIKWNKLTDSLLATSFCYPILSLVKETISLSVENLLLEPFLVAPIVFLTDATLQFIFRKLRGFNTALAFKESLRPAIGDLVALSVWLIFPSLITGTFAYLLVRKIACELYSGHFEAVDKRKQKREERLDALARIFDFSRYKVPDPAAMAAINLCYIAKVKSVTRFELKKILQTRTFGSKDISKILGEIYCAMDDDERIKKAAEFIFPYQDQKDFLDWMINSFYKNRHFFKTYFKV